MLQPQDRSSLGLKTSANKESIDADEMRARLQTELSAEDPFNGEMVIRNIDRPFILGNEIAEVESWCI